MSFTLSAVKQNIEKNIREKYQLQRQLKQLRKEFRDVIKSLRREDFDHSIKKNNFSGLRFKDKTISDYDYAQSGRKLPVTPWKDWFRVEQNTREYLIRCKLCKLLNRDSLVSSGEWVDMIERIKGGLAFAEPPKLFHKLEISHHHREKNSAEINFSCEWSVETIVSNRGGVRDELERLYKEIYYIQKKLERMNTEEEEALESDEEEEEEYDDDEE